MNTLEPVSVALKFGFLAVLYLFLLWVARSARRDLGARLPFGGEGQAPGAIPPDATGLYSASALSAPTSPTARPGSWSNAPPGTMPA